jgi:hypothetical protein
MNLNLKEFAQYKPTPAEKKRRIFVEERLRSMDTPYRQSVLSMVQLGRDATDGIVTTEDRVSNAELIKVPISHAVVSQRLSTLMDNPSRALYKSFGEDKSRLMVTEQLNKYDKIEGRYDSSYHDFMRTSEIEGACIFKQGWHEEFETRKHKGKEIPVTIGKMFTSQEKVLPENFFWDASANELRGTSGTVANDAMDREYMSLLDFRLKYGDDDNFKNVNCVKPLNGSDPLFGDHVYLESWDSTEAKEKAKSPEMKTTTLNPFDISRQVVVWNYYCMRFLDEESNTVKDRYIVYANGIEIRYTDVPVPKIKGKAQLPYGKFVAIPTGGMWGISMPAIIRHPEQALQRMITMADAQAELSVNPVQFMSSGIMDTLDKAPLFPGARVEVAMNGRTIADEVFFHQSPDITNGAQYIIDKMLQLIVMITGVDIQALFESPKAKAISTERKREISERLLRYSVIYNESHGFFDLEEMRLFLMLQNYPVKRYFVDMDNTGKEHITERYPRIPVNGFIVKISDTDLEKPDDVKSFKLVKSEKSFDLLTVNPTSIEYNVHLYVKGATDAANEDTFELNKSIEKVNLLVSNPWTQQIIDPMKGGRQIFEMLNIDENDWIKEELEKSNSDMHGAMKEIQALMLKEIMPIELKLDDDYDAKEYTDIFMRFIQLKDFAKLSAIVKQAIMERYQWHMKNSMNPYYKETLAAEKLAISQGASNAMGGQLGTPGSSEAVKSMENMVVEPPSNKAMEESVDSKAAKLGKAGKTRAEKSQEQRRTIVS